MALHHTCTVHCTGSKTALYKGGKEGRGEKMATPPFLAAFVSIWGRQSQECEESTMSSSRCLSLIRERTTVSSRIIQEKQVFPCFKKDLGVTTKPCCLDSCQASFTMLKVNVFQLKLLLLVKNNVATGAVMQLWCGIKKNVYNWFLLDCYENYTKFKTGIFSNQDG